MAASAGKQTRARADERDIGITGMVPSSSSGSKGRKRAKHKAPLSAMKHKTPQQEDGSLTKARHEKSARQRTNNQTGVTSHPRSVYKEQTGHRGAVKWRSGPRPNRPVQEHKSPIRNDEDRNPDQETCPRKAVTRAQSDFVCRDRQGTANQRQEPPLSGETRTQERGRKTYNKWAGGPIVTIHAADKRRN